MPPPTASATQIASIRRWRSHSAASKASVTTETAAVPASSVADFISAVIAGERSAWIAALTLSSNAITAGEYAKSSASSQNPAKHTAETRAPTMSGLRPSGRLPRQYRVTDPSQSPTGQAADVRQTHLAALRCGEFLLHLAHLGALHHRPRAVVGEQRAHMMRIVSSRKGSVSAASRNNPPKTLLQVAAKSKPASSAMFARASLPTLCLYSGSRSSSDGVRRSAHVAHVDGDHAALRPRQGQVGQLVHDARDS